jgi:hypothetical protein
MLKKIYEVKDVHLFLLKSFPPQLLIQADGLVTSTGWTDPELIPYIYIQPPPDGIYDFDFVAKPPTGISQPVLTDIRASHVVFPIPDNLKGVRVHSSTNSVERLLYEASEGDTRTQTSLSRVLTGVDCQTRDWYAWNNLMPPPPYDFHIVGQVYVANPGIRPYLIEIDSPDPDTIHLELLQVQEPGFWPQVFVWKQVRFEKVLPHKGYRWAVVFCEGKEIARVEVHDVQ